RARSRTRNGSAMLSPSNRARCIMANAMPKRSTARRHPTRRWGCSRKAFQWRRCRSRSRRPRISTEAANEAGQGAGDEPIADGSLHEVSARHHDEIPADEAARLIAQAERRGAQRTANFGNDPIACEEQAECAKKEHTQRDQAEDHAVFTQGSDRLTQCHDLAAAFEPR